MKVKFVHSLVFAVLVLTYTTVLAQEDFSKKALPVVTFTTDVTFHVNGDEMHVFHVASGHTDGDAIVHFKKANVFHLGDIFFNKLYPFIDTSSGGSVDGMIAAVDKVLNLANDDTKLIPGHGPLATKADLKSYRDMHDGETGTTLLYGSDENVLPT